MTQMCRYGHIFQKIKVIYNFVMFRFFKAKAFFLLLLSLSTGCLKQSSGGNSSSSASSVGQQGPAGPAGPQGPAGAPSLYVYDANNNKIGSWLISRSVGGSAVSIWDSSDEVVADYLFLDMGEGTSKYYIPLDTFVYTSTDCTGTPYVQAIFRGSNSLVMDAYKNVYKTSNNVQQINIGSSLHFDLSSPNPIMCSTWSNPVSQTVILLSLYSGNMPVSLSAPIKISPY